MNAVLLTIWELLQNSGFVALAIFVINIIFNLGFYKARLKQFPEKEEVIRLMEKQREEFEQDLKDKFAGHCIYGNDVASHKTRLDGHDAWIKSHEKYAAEANEANHILLQELVLNTQNICNKLKIKYLKKNGG